MKDQTPLLADWRRYLRARGVSVSTISAYVQDVARPFSESYDPLTATRRDVQRYLGELAERSNLRRPGGISPATVRKHFRHLKQLFRWLVEEEYRNDNPMDGMREPIVPEKPIDVLTANDISDLLSKLPSMRDRAIVRLFLDTGLRCSELVNLTVEDIDLDTLTVTVLGKGRKIRTVPFGLKTGEAIRKYLRTVKPTGHLWIGRKGPLTASGIRQLLRRVSADLHPHVFRHTFAHVWLSNGGQETDLMRLMGWKSREMVARYGASTAVERAHKAYRQIMG